MFFQIAGAFFYLWLGEPSFRIVQIIIKDAGFKLTFQSCIVKNFYKISQVLGLLKCTPWLGLKDTKCINFACYKLLLENALSNVN